MQLKSLEMSLINGKIELNSRWKKYCLLTAAIADNNNANSNNIISNIKDTKFYVLVVTFSKTIKTS